MSTIYHEPQTMRYFISDYNSHLSWWIFTLFAPIETEMKLNTIQMSNKIYNSAVTSTEAMFSAVQDDHG